ncbi:MAG: tetratricopeptide repeat protein, partial [Nitrospirales bacterium]
MEQGTQLFAAHHLEAAKKEYEAAIKIQPSLAEAHYNLALTLEQLGNPKEARHHYLEAANLAPGHKVIWNSPPLRRYGNVQSESEYEASESGGGHSH